MTRKIKDLQLFAYEMGIVYGRNLRINDIKYEIAKKYGTSKYIMNSVLESLIEFNVIREEYMGVYHIVEKKTKKEIDKESKDEADKLLKDIKHAKPDKQ